MKTYFLKHKDLLLAEISCELDSVRIDKVYHKPKLLFMLDSDYNMKYWLSTRQTLINRQNANELFKVAGIKFIEDFLDVTMALSLSDCLWVTRDNSIKWSSVSLFTNSFNKVLTDIASGLYGHRGVFVKSPSPEFTIGGSCLKWCKRVDNDIKLFKSSGGLAELQYSGAYSEYLVSQLCSYIGVSHVRYDLTSVREMIVSVSSFYTNERVHSIPVGYLYNDCNHLDDHIKHYSGDLLQQFIAMMIVDCLVINVDRHSFNIELLYDDNFNIICLAPMFDFDHSLYYDLLLINRSDEYIHEGCEKYYPATFNSHTFKQQFDYLGVKSSVFEKLLEEFEFKNHPKLPLNSERLVMINRLFKKNLMELLYG